ncbi:hypothetical protein CLIB1423_01S06700 [[Candida] railenensis]|uniref:Nudix hydrolase domain-containing protein n=1 Tax=[Candida] railenensis TaxID=45579 RepID=A0A9P0QKL9_9ASCO|nr:hypothetical protein CLIB1423_01S06700 [[Candida] railenensis]
MTSSKYKYTIGFIRCVETNQVLLLNRQKAPWMGRWNGVGGKLDPNESPYDCIVRETLEETGLELPQYVARGVLTWETDGVDVGGGYLFTADVSKEMVANYATPKVFCHEGILDWKLLDWILNKDNVGIVDNIRLVMDNLFEAKENDIFKTKYRDGRLESVVYSRG